MTPAVRVGVGVRMCVVAVHPEHRLAPVRRFYKADSGRSTIADCCRREP
jgi:hypothetical protein